MVQIWSQWETHFVLFIDYLPHQGLDQNMNLHNYKISAFDENSVEIMFTLPLFSQTIFMQTNVLASVRKKRDASLTLEQQLKVEREMECVSWMDGSAAYWKYEYEVPAYCYSKILFENLLKLLCLYFNLRIGFKFWSWL